MVETKIKTDDVTLTGSQSTIQTIPESIPRFQLRFNNKKLRKDAYNMGMQFDHIRTYLDVSMAKVFNTMNGIIEDYDYGYDILEEFSHLLNEN